MPEKVPEHRQSGASCKEWPSTTQPWGPQARRLPAHHLGCLKRHLSGNQEVSVYVPILLLAIVVTLEPSGPTLDSSVYPSAISLSHDQDKNTNQNQQNCFDHRWYSKSIHSCKATTRTQLQFVCGEAMHPLFQPDPCEPPRFTSNGLCSPFAPEPCTARQLPDQNTLLCSPSDQHLPCGPTSPNDANC